VTVRALDINAVLLIGEGVNVFLLWPAPLLLARLRRLAGLRSIRCGLSFARAAATLAAQRGGGGMEIIVGCGHGVTFLQLKLTIRINSTKNAPMPKIKIIDIVKTQHIGSIL